jgi:hypothetical protein
MKIEKGSAVSRTTDKTKTNAYSGEVDQGSGVMPISVPVDSDQVIGAERRWQSDCVGSDRNRQEEVGSEMGFGAKRR